MTGGPRSAGRAQDRARAGRRRALVLAVVFVAVLLVLPSARRHLRAAALLTRFSEPASTGLLASFANGAIDEEDGALAEAGGARTRLYWPRGAKRPPGIVLVHGVHRLGIDEGRLVRFARAIAGAGCAVLTPEVVEIAAYRIEPASIGTIGLAARALDARIGAGRAGVMGMSFAGGLSLLAAADPRFRDDIGFVVAVGAHDDLGRVSRFFATDRAERPDGSFETLAAHPYGVLVLVYGDVDAFFPGPDAPIARDAIRLALWEKHDEAHARADALSPEGRARLLGLFDHKLEALGPQLLEHVRARADVLRSVSPAGHLGTLAAPVFLLHGAGDTVIPATETLWLEREVAPALLREALVSPAIVHVEFGKQPGAGEQIRLVHFMASVLRQAESG